MSKQQEVQAILSDQSLDLKLKVFINLIPSAPLHAADMIPCLIEDLLVDLKLSDAVADHYRHQVDPLNAVEELCGMRAEKEKKSTYSCSASTFSVMQKLGGKNSVAPSMQDMCVADSFMRASSMGKATLGFLYKAKEETIPASEVQTAARQNKYN